MFCEPAHDARDADHLPLQSRIAHVEKQAAGPCRPARGLACNGNAQFAAVIQGRCLSQDVPDLAGAPLRDLQAAMTWDADVFRAFMEMITMLAPPQEIMTRPGLARKITEAAAELLPNLVFF